MNCKAIDALKRGTMQFSREIAVNAISNTHRMPAITRFKKYKLFRHRFLIQRWLLKATSYCKILFEIPSFCKLRTLISIILGFMERMCL